jgi:hypothetical protein
MNVRKLLAAAEAYRRDHRPGETSKQRLKRVAEEYDVDEERLRNFLENDQPPPRPFRFVSYEELRSVYGFKHSRNEVARLVALGLFPKPVKSNLKQHLSPSGRASVRNQWVSYELEDHQAALLAARDAEMAAAPAEVPDEPPPAEEPTPRPPPKSRLRPTPKRGVKVGGEHDLIDKRAGR